MITIAGIRVILVTRARLIKAKACQDHDKPRRGATIIHPHLWRAYRVAYDADPHRIENYLVRRLFIAACLAADQQRFLRAATIFGLADQAQSRIHNVIGGPLRAKADAALAAVRAALNPADFVEAYAAGQQLSFAEAYANLLTPVHIAPTLSNPQGKS